MSVNNVQENPIILLASDDSILIKRYTEILGDEFTVSVAETASSAMQLLKQLPPQLAMLDPLLFKNGMESTILEIASAAPLSRIAVIEDTSSRSLDQMLLFKTGVHGFFANDISPVLLAKAVRSVSIGEVWVPRKLITSLISELSRKTAATNNKQDPEARKSMSRLTPRELEVAQMVHSGGNNKTIARELAISERTVKAHLSAIFRKLNIANRLHLALFFNQIT